MKINNVELKDIDIYDLEVAEAWEKIKNEAVSLEGEVKGLSAVASIRLQCNFVFDAFNKLFGAGTDKKVFGDRVNLIVCLDAFQELANNLDKSASRIEKYSSNRLERRNTNRNKGNNRRYVQHSNR